MEKVNLQRIDSNRAEYMLLKNDSSYVDVRFNERTGGLLAIHREHHFDPTIGKFGLPRGDYATIAAEELYQPGNCVLLESETSSYGIKGSEGLLDREKFDIKGVEGTGKRNIEYKIYNASEKGAKIAVLYYHDKSVFSAQNIVDGYSSYLRNSKSKKIKTVYYILDGELYKVNI
ncbi:MAG: hypothetical protein LBH84_07485 [Prevotellaceae bacterium]|jgi:hypothetical protein|nr:hypothetical protein [Prevotellaceae bacterium]